LVDGVRQLAHLLVTNRVHSEDFLRVGRGDAKIRPVESRTRGTLLLEQVTSAFTESDGQRESIELNSDELRSIGTFIVLEGSDVSFPLKLESLEQRSAHRTTPTVPKWLLMSVRPAAEDLPEQAVVWVSDAYRAVFLKLFQDYLEKKSTAGKPKNWETRDGNPANRALVANISRIRGAVLHDLWQSADEPQFHGKQWWELWLVPGEDAVEALRLFAQNYNARVRKQVLVLSDRIVMWVETEWEVLSLLPFTNVPLAEVRKPQFIETVEDLTIEERNEYVEELASRIIPAAKDAPAICHLDTGVARTHLLLIDSLDETDLHDVIGNSGFDIEGHGTAMAGIALYGGLDALLSGAGQIQLLHRLESVRILPNESEIPTDPLDYGTVTIQAVALPEATIQRPRVFCMPISTKADRRGEPSLWSASVDALAAGSDVVRTGDELKLMSLPSPEAARLIVVAAGNVGDFVHDHLNESDTSVVEDPAQSWNAITVGAHTELTTLPIHPQYEGWSTVAASGQLSPHSRTSLLFAPKWPIKPDICMEGGNVLTDGESMFEIDLPLLTIRTTGTSNDSALKTTHSTSAAAAQVSRLAALIMSHYPNYWPETVRALLVHAAEWTPMMRAEIDAKANKQQQLLMLRRYGWGVPTEDSVLRSSRQAVTIVAQDQFTPIDGPALKRQFRIHDLPWPAEELRRIDDADVILRVTLSYFVEPSASRRGWRKRHAYASHSLRFELKNPLEDEQKFIARINRAAGDDEDGTIRSTSGADRWLIGANQRNLGSIHQDIWEGSGQELAACNSIAVYCVNGWWKNSGRKDRQNLPIRYALIVSLKTQEQGVDLYTPIATEIGIPIPIEI
jgi:hypothetical protein